MTQIVTPILDQVVESILLGEDTGPFHTLIRGAETDAEAEQLLTLYGHIVDGDCGYGDNGAGLYSAAHHASPIRDAYLRACAKLGNRVGKFMRDCPLYK